MDPMVLEKGTLREDEFQKTHPDAVSFVALVDITDEHHEIVWMEKVLPCSAHVCHSLPKHKSKNSSEFSILLEMNALLQEDQGLKTTGQLVALDLPQIMHCWRPNLFETACSSASCTNAAVTPQNLRTA